MQFFGRQILLNMAKENQRTHEVSSGRSQHCFYERRARDLRGFKHNLQFRTSTIARPSDFRESIEFSYPFR